jgi:peptide/nickel transport system substrate-binding protein
MRATPAVSRMLRFAPLAFVLVLAASCRPADACRGDTCGTLVVAALGEPETLLPAVTDQQLARDVHDQLFLKLADVGMSANTVGDADFEPQLAQRWEWEDSLTIVFHLNPAARWHDGRPVTAGDVAFTYAAYTDSLVNSPARPSLARIAGVTARDSLTVAFRFAQSFPEMFYEAVHHLRILPAHLLGDLPRDQWRTAAFGRAPVGNGPYRLTSWTAGVALTLTADTGFFLGPPHIARLVWRFQPDLAAAVNLVVAGEADAIEILVTPDNVQRASEAPHLTTYRYAGLAYGYLGFNLRANGNPSRPHPIFGDRDVRRALAMAVDRERMRENALGELARVPPGPIATLWPLWEPRPRELPYDTAAARRLLAERGWIDRDGDGVREKAGVTLSFGVMLPSTSGLRRQYARLLQDQLAAVGARVTIDEVDGPVHGERTASGRFDAYLGAWNVDPTPSTGIGGIWTSAAVGRANHGRYANPAFDDLVARATSGAAPADSVRALWHRALEVFNDDAPAIVLFAMDNVAAVHTRVAGVRIRPDSHWALVRTWRIPADRMIERDRVAPAAN